MPYPENNEGSKSAPEKINKRTLFSPPKKGLRNCDGGDDPATLGGLVPVFFAPIKVKETAEEVKTTINPYGAGNRNPSAETRPRAVKPQGPSYREDDDQPNSSRGEKKTTRPSRLALQLLLFLLFH